MLLLEGDGEFFGKALGNSVCNILFLLVFVHLWRQQIGQPPPQGKKISKGLAYCKQSLQHGNHSRPPSSHRTLQPAHPKRHQYDPPSVLLAPSCPIPCTSSCSAFRNGALTAFGSDIAEQTAMGLHRCATSHMPKKCMVKPSTMMENCPLMDTKSSHGPCGRFQSGSASTGKSRSRIRHLQRIA